MINNVSRHIWLVDLVGSQNGITFKEVNEKWKRAGINPTGEDLPLRTFNNWKTEISKQFGIDFYCDRRTNKYYIRRFDDMQNGGMKEWLLNAFTVSNLLSERDALEGRILLEDVPSGQTCLKPVVDSMKDNCQIRFNYQKFVTGDQQEVIFEPYCVKLHERRWYVLGRNVEKEALRTYALDRMSRVERLTKKFRIPKGFSAEEYYADCFGVIHNDAIQPEYIRLRVDSIQRDYLRTLPLHRTQRETLTADDYSEFTLFLRPTFDFIQHILAQREFIEVLEPLTLRDKMKNVIQEMLKKYD